MEKQEPNPPKRKRLPASVIAIAVLATGVATAWALSATKLGGPQASWQRAEEGVDQVWANQAGMPPTMGGAAPTTGVPAEPSAARTVAGLPGVPAITWGVMRPHPDRGPCANCHTVMDRDARPLPKIHSFSTMPHEFRGNCSNCHQITVGTGLTGNPVAATLITPPAAAAAPVAPTPAPRQPNDADWRGVEVRAGAQGVVVTNAEGAAARRGVLPGDGVVSINGVPIRSMTDFVGATQNGNLPQGTMIVNRAGQRLALELPPKGGMRATTMGAGPGGVMPPAANTMTPMGVGG